MKIIFLFALLASSVAAFSVQPSKTASTALKSSAFDDELGAQAPLGFWDPLNFCEGGDPEKFERYRYVELKHGRVAMLAFLGEVVTRAGIHLPGVIDKSGTTFDSIPNGWEALSAGGVPKLGTIQLFVFVGILETVIMMDRTGEGEFPGDFRNGSLDYGWDTFDETEKLSKRSIEISNGRAAMIGSLIILVAEQLHVSLPIIGQM
mmetsp:Transcript_14830/g.17541  ORF Transcript_14830/g.17541 Transcript_14830/m.17541 type:complete len:205 (-) Transcript_14830:254-868(-)|eukprot:CAMPEP_0198253506 /NCGR_PEP_ID=MMETSP1447-20131203/3913_1 /TAXON_ID=420782 /ORGANISM="Chaetoceros dichaeta, Strain CCMP1751" /LENGTH=204 /DNA_ID=CAMNT_0043939199 /DNA_START=56 /DNA_END=670 /DNA_ORIENTATION=+